MTQPKKKPLTHCEKYGHCWVSTTADNYRKCSYAGCTHGQRFVAGNWETVPALSQKNASPLDPSEHVSLWG